MKLKKALSGILAAAMVVSLTPAMAFATTTNTISGVSTVAKSTEFTKTVEIAVKGVISNWAGYSTTGSGIYTEELTLNVDGAKWLFKNSSGNKDTSSKLESSQFGHGLDPVSATVTDKDGAPIGVTATVAYCSSNSVTLKITNASAIKDGNLIQLTLNLKSGTSTGDVTLSMSSNEGDISSLDSRTIATIVSGKTVATVPDYGTDDLETLTVRNTKQIASDIQIRESSAGVVTGNNEIKLTLPQNVEWNADMLSDGGNPNTYITGSMKNSITSVAYGTDSDGQDNKRILVIKFVASSDNGTRRTLNIVPCINTTKKTSLGEVAVTLRATSGNISDASNLVIGKVIESAVSVYIDTEDNYDEGEIPAYYSGIDLFAGGDYDDDDYIYITVEEKEDGDLIAGQWIDFTFDKKVQLAGTVTVDCDGPAGTLETASKNVAKNRSSFGYKLGNLDDGKANELVFKIPVTVEAGYEGDITCTVSGSAAGIEDDVELVVATAKPVITVTSETSEVRTGVQKQAISDIVITETEIGALKDGKKVEVELPFVLSADAKVEVTSGDLEIDNISADKNSATISFEIDGESVSNAGVITISELQVTLDRVAAEGGYDVKVSGSAVVTNGDYNDDNFDDEYTVEDLINIITPADSTTVSEKVQAAFVIGEASYTNNGAATEMDAAPYIDSHNRTMVPIRYVANACGISENDIRWEQNTQTAIINGLNTVVTVKMGSNKLQTSTGEITMDTAAVNNNGRIYVPVRYIANALGANVSWDAATKTVTLTK